MSRHTVVGVGDILVHRQRLLIHENWWLDRSSGRSFGIPDHAYSVHPRGCSPTITNPIYGRLSAAVPTASATALTLRTPNKGCYYTVVLEVLVFLEGQRQEVL